MSPSDLATHWDHLANQMDLVVQVSLEREPEKFDALSSAMHRLAEGFREIATELRRDEG